MRAIIAPNDMTLISNQLRSENQTIGLVPTMGALHEGHLSLVKESLSANDTTVVSIFINPLQFNKEEDLVNYPKTLDEDLSKLEAIGVDYVFQPSAREFYPEKPKVSISFGEMERVLEGEFRPGHFAGVGVVVSKLLHIVDPDRSYFGLKDLQQFLLIKRMARDLAFRSNIIGVETKRESSGLAMSSRNLRLTESGKTTASKIYEGLKIASKAIEENKNPLLVKKEAVSFFEDAGGIELEYLEIVNGRTLRGIESYDAANELAVCFAGYVEGVRLIDNLYLRLK